MKDQRGVIGLVLLGLIVIGMIAVAGSYVYQVRSGHAQPLLQRVHH